MFRVLSDRSTIRSGRLAAKNARETENGGFVIHYNNGPKAAEGNAVTVFYINPHLENMPEAMRLVDGALSRLNAQVKVYTEDMTDVQNPASRPSNKIVVYFRANDHEGITAFLRSASHHAQEWRTLLKPEDFSRVMTTFRIPLMPGFTLIERNSERSWDTTYINRFLGGDRRLRPLIEQWAREGKKPTQDAWERRILPLMSRHRTMPGLRGGATP
jgi:hypothetical protein